MILLHIQHCVQRVVVHLPDIGRKGDVDDAICIQLNTTECFSVVHIYDVSHVGHEGYVVSLTAIT